MNAPAQFFEREALSHAVREASNDRIIARTSAAVSPKTSNLSFGFQDDAGNTVLLVDQSRQYHIDARTLGVFPPAPSAPTEAGRVMAAEALRIARQGSAKFVTPAPTLHDKQRNIGSTSWSDTPVKHRRIIAHLACLPSDISNRLDRELTESEKTLLRAAARDLYEGINGLSASL